MKKVIILGGTGSIGKNTVRVIQDISDRYDINVAGISANTNVTDILQIANELNIQNIAITGYKKIDLEYNGNVFLGSDSLTQLIDSVDADILVNAVVGAAGLPPTVHAIKKGMRIALANKEVLVIAGNYIDKLLKEYNTDIIPIDSEHNAIFQCLEGNKDISYIKKIILTASGGPFLNHKGSFDDILPEEALAHPTWSMGSKITIDSATLMNKGFEVIEAHHLFHIDYDNIEVVIHPQSIIHSMVEYIDKSILAHLGPTDMYIPILYALTYPNKMENKRLDSIDLTKINQFSFIQPDYEKFPNLNLAYECGKYGGNATVILNAANEIAVHLFLNQKIKFSEIPVILRDTIEKYKNSSVLDIDDIYYWDNFIRERLKEKYKLC